MGHSYPVANLICEKCGIIHDPRKCQAHSKQSGKQCTQSPHPGATICRFHGLTNPTRAVAARNVAEIEVNRVVDRLVASEDRTPDPIHDLHRAMVRATALADLLEERVRQLEVWRYQDAKGAEQLHSYVALYERAIERVQKFAVEYARLGLEARMVKLEEEKVNIVLAALQAAFEAAAVPQEQAVAIRTELVKQLRA